MSRTRGLTVLILFACAVVSARPGHAVDPVPDPTRGIEGHWPLKADAKDVSGHGSHAEVRGNVDFGAEGPGEKKGTAAALNGRDAWLEIPSDRSPRLGTNDFSLLAWINVPESLDDVPGDVLSQYDPARRRGFTLGLKTSAVTASVANERHLCFGIDNDRASEWIDCGRPGNAVFAFSMAAHDGVLYAGTCEAGADERGHVYRYGGKQTWIDCGSPDASNSVTSLAVYRGELYAATGKYRLAGSALVESQNATLGGRIFRYAGEKKWIDCGQLPDVEAVGGMIVFRDRLYASSLYRPAGFFRYEGEARWSNAGTPDGKRVNALGVFDGFLYATSYDGGYVYRFDGETWTDCGRLGENTQTYSFAPYHGKLYVGTWPSGRVYRFEDIGRWTDTGRLGDELEVMGMLVHNGRLIAGSLPLAEVYEYEGDAGWKKLARLDHTPDTKYRRAWTMAEHDGKLFCSTLPSGKIYSFEAGRNALWERPFPAGWHHVAAVKSADRLSLHVDGKQVARSSTFDASDFNLDPAVPLKIGLGPNDHFLGRLSDVRIHRRALSPAEIEMLAKSRE